MVGANLLQAAILLPLIAVDSAGTLWIAYLVIAAQALLANFVIPAEHALLPRLVPEADLPAANGLNALNNNIARLLGPAVGGVVAATMGLSGAVLLDSAAMLIAALLAALIAGNHRADRGDVTHFVAELTAGVRAITQSKVLVALFAVIAVTAIGEGIMGSLFPVFVADALGGGVQQIAWLMSAQAVGGIIGGLACGRVARRLSPTRMLTLGLPIFGLIDIVIFNYPRWFTPFGPVVVLFIVIGIPAAIMTAAWFTLLQTEVADGLRARVISAVLVVEGLAMLAGAAIAGTLTDRFGVLNVLTGQGVGYVLAAAAFALLIRRTLVRVTPAVPQSDPLVSASSTH